MIHDSLDMPTSLIMSGVEVDIYWDIAVKKCGVKTVLTSYQYLKNKPKDFLKKKLADNPDVKVFIDSGAHTFFKDIEGYASKPKEYWDKYLEEYTNFARENKEYIFAIANLDIGQIVGAEVEDEWNEKIFQPLEEEGIQVCYIWHSFRGEQAWEEYAKKYSYIGLSNDFDTTLQRLTKMTNICKKYNTRIHGMAFTKIELLTRVPLFTVDSSVDGKSSVVVKDFNTGTTFRTNIEDLYNLNLENEFRTTDFETRVPFENYKVLTVDNDNKVIWGDLYGVVKHKVKKPTVKLKIEGGKDIICTTDHSIITMNKEGKLVETSANDLKVGDFVLSSKQYDIQNANNDKLDTKMLEFLGLWLGDGCFTSKYDIGMSCYSDKECIEVIDEIAKRFNASLIKSSHEVDRRISNKGLRVFMEELGFKGNSKTKRIPKSIYSLSKEQICAFLRGYFSADGTGSCECSTVSEELKNDLVELLEMLGINTSVSYRAPRKFTKDNKEYNASPIWHINIRNRRSKEIFREMIGFLQEYKNLKLDKIIESTPLRCAKLEGIPKSLAISNTIKTSSKSSTSVDKWKGDRISRKYSNVFSNKVTESELWFLKITDIESVNDGSEEVEVYDLSVKDYERFFANGILVHNTTWLVGQQYGELNFFNGRKMERLSKRQWQTQAKGRLLKPPYNADWEKLMTGGKDGGINTYELTRLNGIAYMEAQEYIRTRLKNKMYWLPLNTARNANKGGNKLGKNTDFPKPIPSREWFNGDMRDYEQYARGLNISTATNSYEDIMILLKCYYGVANGDLDFLVEEFTEEGLILYAEQVTEQQFEEVGEDLLEALKEYFLQNATGERKDFLAENEALERERYIEDEAFTIVDLSAEELALPPPDEMPEVSELDAELASKGVVTVRDEKGRFIKGQKAVRKPKNIYSEKYPKMNCSTCYKSGDCPQYKDGYVCAFDKMFKRFDSRNYEDVVDAMASMVNTNLERMQRAMMFEVMDGGFITPEVNNLIDQNVRLLEKMQSLQNTKKPILSQTRVVNSDGSEQTTTQVEVGAGASILEKLFGNSNSNSKYKDEEESIEADYKEV